MWPKAIKSITKYYFLILFHTDPSFGKRAVSQSSTKPVTKRNNRSLFIATIPGRARASASSTGIKAQLPPARLHYAEAARHRTSPAVGGHGRAAINGCKAHGSAGVTAPV